MAQFGVAIVFVRTLLAVLLLLDHEGRSLGFMTSVASRHSRAAFVRNTKHGIVHSQSEETGEVGSGPNWIERSFPVDIGSEEEDSTAQLNKVDDYNLGISGVSYETGPLSGRMFEAMTRQNKGLPMSEEIKIAFTLYAMDFTAKEATKAALKQNGMEMALEEDMEDEGLWGDVDSIQLLDSKTNTPVGPMYDSTDEAIEHWTPGQPFNFVVRQVPAKVRQLALDELLQALDPDGSLREEAKSKGVTMPDEEISSLQALANDNVRRSQLIPYETTDSDEAFAGVNKRGYRVISRSSLLRDSINADGTENRKTLMHVMDALVTHGALVVDLTDGGTTFKLARTMKKMWESIGTFYKSISESPEKVDTLPSIAVAEKTGNVEATVGFGNYLNSSVQFLETRLVRNDNLGISPEGAVESQGIKGLLDSFAIAAQVGKDVIRIATAASSMEANAFIAEKAADEDDDEDNPSLSGIKVLSGDDDDDGTNAAVEASRAAGLMVDELVDDGTPSAGDDIPSSDTKLSFSAQRICRFSKMDKDASIDSEDETVVREIFGARIDSTFVTVIPVSAVSGIEVFDEDEERWYQPELMARQSWEAERTSRDGDENEAFDVVPSQDDQEDEKLPWHARYLVVVPGELLQLVTRNEMPAAVQRFTKVTDGPARLSCSIQLSGRLGTEINVERYLGRSGSASELMSQCDGMKMEDMYDTMQPSFQ